MSLTAEQKADRVNTLGASEIAAVCGLSPWKSVHDVWLSKMGLVDDETSGAIARCDLAPTPFGRGARAVLEKIAAEEGEVRA